MCSVFVVTMDLETLVECFCDFAEQVITCLKSEYEDGLEHETDPGYIYYVVNRVVVMH